MDSLSASSDAEPALTLAERSQTRSVEALADIVRIRSLTGEEGSAQQYVAGLLRGIGAEVVLAEPDIKGLFSRYPQIAQYPTHWQHDLILPYEQLPTYEALVESGLVDVLTYRDRPNVVGILRGTGGGRSLILNAHIDTVTIEPSNKWRHDPFGAAIENGLMYGRGTSDMKGGLMAALLALTYLKEAGVKLRGDVIFQSVVNEEHAGNGTLDLVRRGYKADAAVVLEPTDNRVFVSHPGGLYWELQVPGISRSPGARWEDGLKIGTSAIEVLPPLIDALLALESAFNSTAGTASKNHAERPFSLVFGRIAGGFYETVTAGDATLRGVAYFAPSIGDVGDVMARFRAAVATANATDAFLRDNPARISFLHHDDSTRQSRDIVIAAEAAKLLVKRGGDGEIADAPFCCDMRHLVNQGGIPSIVFGPGTIAQAHKPDEHIAIDDYTASIGHLIALIAEWCGVHAA
jgi:acetylornithine deacetylase